MDSHQSSRTYIIRILFLDPEGGSQKATLVALLLLVVIGSLSKGPKIPKGFLIHRAAQ